MKNTGMLSAAALVLSLGVLAGEALASDWTYYEAKAYGFSMLVPNGTAVREREWSGGWAGITALSEGVRLYGQAKLGPKASDDEIEQYALRVIGIPAISWTQVDSGKNQRGWIRYYTFRATSGSKLVFGGYGVGPKGNYLLYLETTASDYNAYKADYDKWYESIRLD
jgi:hypothetical protein